MKVFTTSLNVKKLILTLRLISTNSKISFMAHAQDAQSTFANSIIHPSTSPPHPNKKKRIKNIFDYKSLFSFSRYRQYPPPISGRTRSYLDIFLV